MCVCCGDSQKLFITHGMSTNISPDSAILLSGCATLMRRQWMFQTCQDNYNIYCLVVDLGISADHLMFPKNRILWIQ